MKKGVKLTLALIVGAGLFWGLTGCGDAEAEPLSGKKIISPVETEYLIANPLIVTEEPLGEDDGAGEDFSYVYRSMSVSGLKDKSVEQKINSRIQEAFNELKRAEAPPYRGIQQVIGSDAEMLGETLFAWVTGNFNNVLSIVLEKNTLYSVDESGANIEDVHDMRVLNFDLNTGEEIPIKAVITDDMDALEILSQLVKNQIDKSSLTEEVTDQGDQALTLSGNFTGLSPDQKYLIQPWGINLIFDYDTPEFNTDRRSRWMSVYYNEMPEGTVALPHRFYEEGVSIYESDEPLVKSLFSGDAGTLGRLENEWQDGPIMRYESISDVSEEPEKIKAAVKQLQNAMPKDELINAMKEEFYSSPDMDEGYVETFIDVSEISSYKNIYAASFGSIGEETFTLEHRSCYDKDTLEKLELSDVFKSNYNYMKVITRAVKTEMENYGYLLDEHEDPEAAAEEQKRQITGFNLEAEGIQISFAGTREEPWVDNFTVYVTYKDFGCDNLKIFEPDGQD